MMGIVVPETCWAYKKHNKIISGIYLVFYSSLITMMQVQNIKFVNWSPDTAQQTILQILESEDLENGKICVQIVPHNLKDEQKHNVTTLWRLHRKAVISHPPYSPDLAATQITWPRVTRFFTPQANLTAELNAVPLEEFGDILCNFQKDNKACCSEGRLTVRIIKLKLCAA